MQVKSILTRTIPILLFGASIFGVLLQAAEEEVIVLSITGTKVDVLENLPASESHLNIIATYYAEIPEISKEELAGLWQQMRQRTEDYQVAFRSGDTAEINETLDDLGYYWASIRTIHAREFTAEAIAAIEAAYAGIFPFIQDPR